MTWNAPVASSEELEPEQRQRAQALRVAREVAQKWEGAGLGAARGSSVEAGEIMLIADWIVTGIWRLPNLETPEPARVAPTQPPWPGFPNPPYPGTITANNPLTTMNFTYHDEDESEEDAAPVSEANPLPF